MMLHARVAKAVHAATSATEKHLTRDARLQAKDAGWPTQIAGRVSAHHTGGAFDIRFAGAEDWEYGTEDRPPLPVARNYANRVHEHADDTFNVYLRHALGGLL